MASFKIDSVQLYFLPAPMRVPLKFGTETLTEVTLARVCIGLKNEAGDITLGWGETPLSVGWVWPSKEDYHGREEALKSFCMNLSGALLKWDEFTHVFEASYAFIKQDLEVMSHHFETQLSESLPHLASLVCYSAFDIALHDAFSKSIGCSAFETLNSKYMSKDLSCYIESDNGHSFKGEYPYNYLIDSPEKIKVWHLVGGLDALTDADLSGEEPDDDHPVTLEKWIQRDELKCLKIKLKGSDADWDFERIVRVGEIGQVNGVEWLSTDFNCVVKEPEYVNAILDRLRDEEPHIYGMLLYVEQPFPYDIQKNPIDVHACSSRKPLFMDESAHDWTYVRMGYRLGWNGVALKTCKTFTGAILSLCWAKAHGMTLMVQDLTNPMLAIIPHVQLAAHAGTIMGVECNGMQFYPEISKPESEIHQGIYQRRQGVLDLTTLSKTGFGYREEEMKRELPEPVFSKEAL
jgi:L-alanine-DL-glutamate epimerase-like enolase superfamily enzyme